MPEQRSVINHINGGFSSGATRKWIVCQSIDKEPEQQHVLTRLNCLPIYPVFFFSPPKSRSARRAREHSRVRFDNVFMSQLNSALTGPSAIISIIAFIIIIINIVSVVILIVIVINGAAK